MIVPRWATTKTQPIALRDVIRYLVGVLEPVEARGRTFEIGGPEVLTYAEMMRRVAHLHHDRPLPMLAVPLLTPRLSSYWLALVTDVDTATARNLVDSMSNEVTVDDASILGVVPGRTMGYDEAVREAFDQRDAALAEDGKSGAPMTGRRARMVGRAIGVVRPVLVDKVDRDHRQSDRAFLRRRIVVGITIVVGATLLGLSFSTEQGEPGVLPADVRPGRDLGAGQRGLRSAAPGSHRARWRTPAPDLHPDHRRPAAGRALHCRRTGHPRCPVPGRLTEDVLGYARYGTLWLVAVITLVNGIAEELFFRGALFAAIGVRHPVLISTVIYTLATVAGGNPVLVFAAAVLGAVCRPAAAGRWRHPCPDPDPHHLVDDPALRAPAGLRRA